MGDCRHLYGPQGLVNFLRQGTPRETVLNPFLVSWDERVLQRMCSQHMTGQYLLFQHEGTTFLTLHYMHIQRCLLSCQDQRTRDCPLNRPAGNIQEIIPCVSCQTWCDCAKIQSQRQSPGTIKATINASGLRHDIWRNVTHCEGKGSLQQWWCKVACDVSNNRAHNVLLALSSSLARGVISSSGICTGLYACDLWGITQILCCGLFHSSQATQILDDA